MINDDSSTTNENYSRSPTKGTLLAFAGLVILVLSIYHHSLANHFAWDDRSLILQNPSIQSLSTALAAFFRSMWQLADPLRGPDFYYRPLGILSFALDNAIGGLQPFVFHLTSLILHTFNGILLFATLRKQTSLLPAFFAAAWFATLPAGTETVCWISDRFDLLGTTFVLGALLISQTHASQPIKAVVQGICVLAALFSKESFAIAPFLLIIGTGLKQREFGSIKELVRRMGIDCLAYGIALAMYFSLRAASSSPSASALGNRNFVDLATDFATTFGETIRILVAPNPLSVTRDYIPYGSSGILTVAVGMVALAALATYKPNYRQGTTWLALACIIPALAVRPQGFMGERYVYLPAIGAAMILATALQSFEGKVTQILLRRICLAALGVWILIQSAQVYWRVPDWKNDRSLFSAALAVNPTSWYALFEMGHAEARENRWDQAARWYRLALNVNQHDPRLLSNASAAFSNSGSIGEALYWGQAAVNANPGNPRAHYNYAVALIHQGNTDQAITELDIALQIAPSYDNARRLRKRLGVAQK